ncbi:hypothetical protein ES702_07377 [subsurface metagenome]
MKAKQANQKEIGRVKVSDTEELTATLVDDENLDLRIFVKTDSYSRPTRMGFRFNLLHITNPFFTFDNWTESKRLVDKIDKVYNQL